LLTKTARPIITNLPDSDRGARTADLPDTDLNPLAEECKS